MSIFGVTPEKEAELRRRMEAVGLTEADLVESFIRSGGPGGQNVNKTATAVRLRHIPTGLEVRSQQARTQGLNRFYARRRMCELLEARLAGDQSPERQRANRIRKQKKRRQRRSRSGGSDDAAPST